MKIKDKLADRIVKCKKCHRTIGRTAFDSQVLILENGLVAFNYFCYRCPCNTYDFWIAPELPTKELTNLEKHPDGQMIERKAVKIRKDYKAAKSKNGKFARS